MKKFFTTLLIAFFGLLNVQGQCTQEITLATQADVDAFPQNYGCSIINGNLSIGVQTEWSNIYNLDSLYQITNINGGLGIYTNKFLTSLSGLENLETIATYFGMRHCDSLTNFVGLTNLQSIGGESNIGLNDLLVNLEGLESLTHLGGIILQYNPQLQNLSGLENLETLEGLSIYNNDILPSLTGLNPTITDLDYLSISQNPLLNDVSNLAQVENVIYDFTVQNNESLTSLSGLDNLTTVGRDIAIVNNTVLTDVSNLNNIVSVGEDFTLTDNPVLDNCCVVAYNIFDNVIGETTIDNNDNNCNSIEAIANSCFIQTGINETPNNPQFTTFPNPNKGQFYLQSSNEPILSLTIQNSLGELILSEKLNNNLNTIDLSNQSKGVYFLTIQTTTGPFVEKIIVQ